MRQTEPAPYTLPTQALYPRRRATARPHPDPRVHSPAGDAEAAIAHINNNGCSLYNVEREDASFCLGNMRFMYLIKQIFSPFFDPIYVMNHRIFGKDSKTTPASYNMKWRISLGAELIAGDERYKDGLVLIDYGGGKASGSATVFKADADDGGKGMWQPRVTDTLALARCKPHSPTHSPTHPHASIQPYFYQARRSKTKTG